MKHFKEIFGKVMMEVSPTDVAMLGEETPIVTVNGTKYAEFLIWANKGLSPNLTLECCYFRGDQISISAKIKDCFTEKSASVLKANGIKEFAVCAEDDCDEDGRPLDASLWLNIPIEPLV